MTHHAKEPERQHSIVVARQKRIAAVLIVAAILGTIDTVHFVHSMETGLPTLKRWLPYAAELGTDNQLYSRHRDYLYPPIFLVLLRPLSWAPPRVAAVVWQLGKYAAIVLTFGVSFRLLGERRPLPAWAKLASILLSARFIHSDLAHGNINIFVAALATYAAFLLARGHAFASGLWVAAAACIKVTPALWIVYLAYRRCWRGLVGAAAGAVLCLFVIPLAVLTPRQNIDLLHDWYAGVVSGYVSSGEVFSQHMNQSLAAVTNRLLGREDLAGGQGRVMTLAHLPPPAIRWIQRAAALALLALLAWSCRGRLPVGQSDLLAVEWALVAAATLLLSGYTWTGHFAHLVLANVAVLAFFSRRPLRQAPRAAWIPALIAYALLCLTGDNLTRAGREWASALGAEMFGTVFLIATLVVIRGRMRRMEEA